MAGYIFGKGTPDTYESLQAKRATAARLAANAASRTPQNVGEGLNALGQAFLYRRLNNQADKGMSEGLGRYNEKRGSLLGQLLGGMPTQAPNAAAGTPFAAPGGASVPPVTQGPIGGPAGAVADDTMRALGKPAMPDAPVGALKVAAKTLGMNERDQQAALQDYLKTGGVNLDPATTAWCAAFVNATLAQSGQQGTGSNMARSFLDWGQGVDQPQPGDVGVLPRGDVNGPYGHVGFVQSVNPDGTISLLAGNQGDAVSVQNYAADKFLGFRRAGEGQPSPQAPQGNMGAASIPALIELINDPFAPEGDRAMLGMLLQRQLDAMQPPDPMQALEMEYKRAQIDKMKNGDDLPDAFQGKHMTAISGGLVPGTPEYQQFMLGSDSTEYGLTAVWGRDQNGNPVPAQLSKNGTIKTVDLPPGWTPDPGLTAQMQAEGRTVGEATGTAKVAIDGARLKTKQAFDLIDKIANDPALPSITGTFQGGYLAPGLPILSGGQAGRDLAARIKNLEGKIFVQAYDSIRGAGQITEQEGQAARDAIENLDRSQSPEAFKEALGTLKTALADLLALSEKKAAGGASPAPGATLTFNPATGDFE